MNPAQVDVGRDFPVREHLQEMVGTGFQHRQLADSQTDIAHLDAEDVNWNDRTICYDRKKLDNRQDTGIKPPLIRFGKEVADILGTLPQKGPLFPYLRTVRPGDRATEFKQRCGGLKIKGISLHSYR